MRKRQHKVLGERIDAAERQIVQMIAAEDGIASHKPQRIVHPAHIPFHRETKSTGVAGT